MKTTNARIQERFIDPVKILDHSRLELRIFIDAVQVGKTGCAPDIFIRFLSKCGVGRVESIVYIANYYSKNEEP